MNEGVYHVLLWCFAVAVYRVAAASYRQKQEVHADAPGPSVTSRSSEATFV